MAGQQAASDLSHALGADGEAAGAPGRTVWRGQGLRQHGDSQAPQETTGAHLERRGRLKAGCLPAVPADPPQGDGSRLTGSARGLVLKTYLGPRTQHAQSPQSGSCGPVRPGPLAIRKGRPCLGAALGGLLACCTSCKCPALEHKADAGTRPARTSTAMGGANKPAGKTGPARLAWPQILLAEPAARAPDSQGSPAPAPSSAPTSAIGPVSAAGFAPAPP